MGNGYAAARWLLIREDEELYGSLWVMRQDHGFDGVCLLYLKMRICNSPAAFFVIAPADGSKNSIAVFKDSDLNSARTADSNERARLISRHAAARVA
jgi:hypothetical protein